MPLAFARAQPQVYRFDSISANEGLPSDTVTALLQDHLGYLWIGTSGGIARYDGIDIDVFSSNEAGRGFGRDRVTALAEDSRGDLWIGSSDRFLTQYDRGTGAFVSHRLPDAVGLPNSLHFDDEGTLWLVTERGKLWRGYPGAGDFARIEAPEYRGVPEKVTGLLVDRAGRLWISSPEALFRLDDATSTFTAVWTDASTTSAGTIGGMYEDRTGNIWIGIGGGQLLRYDPRSGSASTFRLGSDGEAKVFHEDDLGRVWVVAGAKADIICALDPVTERTEFVQSLGRPFAAGMVDHSGVVWMGTHGAGIKKYDRWAQQFPHFAFVPGNPKSLSDPDITVAYEDSDGIIWIGTENGGLNRFERESGSFTQFRHDPGNARSISHSTVNAILEDETGVLWIGTEAGLDRLDRVTGGFQHFIPTRQHLGDPKYNGVRAIMLDSREALWVVTGQGGPYVFDRSIGTFRSLGSSLTAVCGDHVAFGGNSGVESMEDRHGFLWFNSQGGGLFRLQPETEKWDCFRPASFWRRANGQLRSGYILTWLDDSKGELWFGTMYGGLNRFENGTDRFSVFGPESIATASVTGLHEDRSNRLWAAAGTHGLHLIDRGTGTDIPFSLEDGLPHQSAFSISEDRFGALWLTTGNGLSRFFPQERRFTNYTVDEGLVQNTLQRLLQTRDGAVLYKTDRGFHLFSPDAIADNPYPPRVAITSIRLANEELRADRRGNLKDHISNVTEINLNYSQNDLAIEYRGFHSSRPEKVSYTYRLEGLQDDWVAAGSERIARFPNLHHGDYTFRLKAANADGVWNDEGASISIVIHPPWWLTRWAYASYLMLAVLGLFSFDRDRRKRIVKRERRKSEERELENARKIEVAHRNLEAAYSRLQTTQEQLVQSEKMASLGQLTAGIAHEIRNPLNFVNNFSELSEDVLGDIDGILDTYRGALPRRLEEQVENIVASLKENTIQIAEHGKRAERIVRSMLEHARVGTGEREEVDLNSLLEDHIGLAWHALQSRSDVAEIQIERDLDEAVGMVNLVSQEIGRVLVNLLNNAFDAVLEEARRRGTEYRPRVTTSSVRTERSVEIRITDNGPGIPEKIRDKIFEPFFTTKPTGSRTGLGLSMAYDIVTKGHGGTLNLTSEEGQGATFIVRLPI